MPDPTPAASLAFVLLRECVDVQQGQLASRLGCRPSVLSEIEGGTRQASPGRRKEILDHLELRPETFPWAVAFIEKVRTVGRKRRRPEDAEAALLWEIEDLVAEASLHRAQHDPELRFAA